MIGYFHGDLVNVFLIQANWCYMTFTVGNLFPSHSCIGVTGVKPPPGSNAGPQSERQMTYQLSNPSPHGRQI